MDLNIIRQEIDRIDSTIKPLFIERMGCAYNVAMAKAETGGDVYAPVREKQVISSRVSDVSPEIKDEYEAFLLHLMSLCRRYEYGILQEMQEETIHQLLTELSLSSNTDHQEICITFTCNPLSNALSLAMNMIALNGIVVKNLSAETKNNLLHITCTLSGTITDPNMKLLLCQLAKEMQDFHLIKLV